MAENSVKDGAAPSGGSLWAGLTAGGLVLGAAASALVRKAPGLGLLLYLAGGLALGAGALRPGARSGDGRWPARGWRRRAWEPAFLLILLVAAAWPRTWGLNDRPAGAGGHEGELVAQMLQMEDRKDFVIHIQDADINWPTLTVYEAIALTKLMGHQPAAYRMESALWGILAVLALYFALRALFSPESAAAASLMMAGSFFHLVQSRMFFPGTILNFSVLAALALWVTAARRRSAVWAGLAGLAAGLSLWGFIPGRGVPGFFLVWFLFLALGRPEDRPAKSQWIAFWACLVLAASPVIYYAVRWPDFYWAYVSSMNPNRGQGLGSYVRRLITDSAPYFRVFHVQGDSDPGMTPPGQPLLDAVTGWLFPLGFFAAFVTFWRPASAFMIGLFLAGLLPAVMGSGFAHPTTRRMVLAWPALYLLVGLAFERVRAGFNPRGLPGRDRALLAAFLVAAAVAYGIDMDRYFGRFYQTPAVKAHVAHNTYRLYRDHREMPGSRLAVSPIFGGVVWGFYFPRMASDPIWEPEDLLRLPDDRAVDAYLEPLYGPAAGLLRAAVPGAAVELVASPDYPVVNVGRDPFAPQSLYLRVRIPAGKLAEARGMELDGQRVDPWASGFASAHAGKRVGLRATLVAPREKAPCIVRLGWPGFRVRLDGADLPLGSVVTLEGGLHELELAGTVPASAVGGLPLSVERAGVVAPPLLYPFRWDHGLAATYYAGAAGWDSSPARFTRRWAASVYRFHDIYEVLNPYSVRVEGRLTPTADGEARFAPMEPFSQMRIRLDGRVVYCSLPGQPKVDEPFRIAAGRPLKLEAEHSGFPGGALERALQFRWRINGGEPAVIPAECFSPGPRRAWAPGVVPVGKP